MFILTLLKPRALVLRVLGSQELSVIQTLETLLWLSFIIASSVSEVHVAPAIIEESTNIRTVEQYSPASGTRSSRNPGSRRAERGKTSLILLY